MRRIALLLLLLLSGCDLDTLQKENTIKAGKVYWDGPDISRLLTALDTCSIAPSSMDELCTARHNEALILLQALRTCAGNTLPACRGIMHWTLKGDGRSWVYLTQKLGMTPTDFDALPREDLEATLKPQNQFIWAVWGINDAMEVTRRWIMHHLIWVIMGVGLPLLGGLGLLLWRLRQAHLKKEQRKQQERIRIELEREEAVRRREQAEVDAVRNMAERKARAEADAALRARAETEARALEAAEKKAAEAEEARAKAILAKAFMAQHPNHPRHEKRKWKGPKPRPTPQNP